MDTRICEAEVQLARLSLCGLEMIHVIDLKKKKVTFHGTIFLYYSY
jgi:hypothetical protein